MKTKNKNKKNVRQRREGSFLPPPFGWPTLGNLAPRALVAAVLQEGPWVSCTEMGGRLVAFTPPKSVRTNDLLHVKRGANPEVFSNQRVCRRLMAWRGSILNGVVRRLWRATCLA